MRIRIPRVVNSFIYQTKYWPLIFLWIVTLTAGYIGFLQSSATDDFFDRVYSTFKLAVGSYPVSPIIESPLLNFTRFFAFFLTITTLLVVAETLFYERARQLWRAYRGGHTIICGMGSIGRRYIREYLDADNHPFIVIESNPSNPRIKSFREEGVHILIGDATNPLLLEKAGIKTAKNLIAVTGSDTRNAIIASTCELLRHKNPEDLICSVHISNPLLCNLLQAKWYRKELSCETNGKDRDEKSHIKLEPFNIFQLAGMLILEDYPPFRAQNTRAEGSHILVIGGGKFGEAIIQHLPHIWQISPGIHPGSRFKVTLIDKKAKELTKSFLELYPVIRHYCDIIPLDLEVGSAEFLSMRFLFGADRRCPFSVIYICFYDYENGLYAALEIDEALQALKREDRPDIIVRTLYAEEMHCLVGETSMDQTARQKIHLFPLIDRVCLPEFTENGMLTEVLAHATHENYLKTCEEKGEIRERMVPFRNLPENYKKSNRNQVLTYSRVLDQFGYVIRYRSRWETHEEVVFSADEIEKMAEIEHDRWWEEKKAFHIRDHPDFKPYKELSENEKDFDREVFQNMNRLLARVNMKVARKEGFSGGEKHAAESPASD